MQRKFLGPNLVPLTRATLPLCFGASCLRVSTIWRAALSLQLSNSPCVWALGKHDAAEEHGGEKVVSFHDRIGQAGRHG